MSFKNPFEGKLLPAPRGGGFRMDDYYIWCGSVVRSHEDGKYYMFASRWPKSLGFGWNWLFHSEVVRAVSDTPYGPFTYDGTVLPQRGAQYFDGKNTHNPMIRYWNGTYYLYYMGCTYYGEPPKEGDPHTGAFAEEVWNRKRIGLATSKSVKGPFVRRDDPILLPRDCSHWDCTITTNPAVAILPDGTTYMLYKSRSYVGAKLQIGVAVAPSPESPFTRLSENPIFANDDSGFSVEDPYLWYADGYFHLIIKDNFHNGSTGVTGVWGSGFYARSRDCLNWELPEKPLVYSRKIKFDDGTEKDMPNAERPFVLFDETGNPVCLYLATGDGDAPYDLSKSYNIAIPLAQ